MARTLHHGWRVDATVHPSPLHLEQTLRATLMPVYRTLYTRKLAKEAAYLFDATSLALPRGDRHRDNPLADASAELHEAQSEVRRTMRRDPERDFMLEITMLANADEPSSDWFMLVHTEHDEYRDALASLPGVQFWPWYAAEYPPDGVSQQEWDYREAVWARVVPDPFHLGGLRFELFTKFHQLRARDVLDEVAAALPTLEQRAGTVASRHTRIADVVDGQIRMRDLDRIVADRDAMAADVLSRIDSSLGIDQLRAPYAA